MIDMAYFAIDLLVVMAEKDVTWSFSIAKKTDKSEVLMTFLITFLDLLQGQSFFTGAFWFVFIVVDVSTSHSNNSFAFCSDLLI